MRTQKSIKNSITTLIGNGISCIIAFFAQMIFIKTLGIEYLGLDGLFTNILTMFSIFELGIGNAIVYNLYKPVADKDYRKISALLNFYKKAYNIISIVIVLIGITILPFIPHIVGKITIDINIYLIYILFLVNTISSYFMIYKRNLIVANQESYIINIIHVIYIIIVNIIQLLIIYLTKNYYLFLIIKIICQILENIIISLVANKKYEYLKKYKNEQLDKKTTKDIFSRVSALFFHKIGNIMINSTDNIIISRFLGIAVVGIYSNYYMVIGAISMLFGQVITATTASIGNYIVSENKNKIFQVFKKIRFINFYISMFTSICLLLIIQPFINIWVGKNFLLEYSIVIVLVFNFFQKMQRNTYNAFKDSAGIWKEDKFIPLIESALNILFSIIGIKIFGLIGVFIGTIISGLVLWCYSYPKYVYKKLLKRSYKNYAIETIGYILTFILIALTTYGFSLIFSFDNLIIQIIVELIICISIPNLLFYVIFRKTDNFGYIKYLIKNAKK